MAQIRGEDCDVCDTPAEWMGVIARCRCPGPHSRDEIAAGHGVRYGFRCAAHKLPGMAHISAVDHRGGVPDVLPHEPT
jgi:hypothetical protein